MSTVGVIGLGYVGPATRGGFRRAGLRGDRGRRRPAQDRGDRVRRVLHRGHPLRAAARRRRSHPRLHPLRASGQGRRGDRVRADAADPQSRARPRSVGRLHARARRGAPAGSARRVGVHHLSRHDPRARRAAAGGVRAGGRPRLPPGVLARARRSRPDGFHAAHHPQGDRRADRAPARSARKSSTGWSATRSCASPLPRPPS